MVREQGNAVRPGVRGCPCKEINEEGGRFFRPGREDFAFTSSPSYTAHPPSCSANFFALSANPSKKESGSEPRGCHAWTSFLAAARKKCLRRPAFPRRPAPRTVRPADFDG